MIIKLFQPPTNNWILIAEQLDDPQTWDRFIPCHTADSQRWRFDTVVKQITAASVIKLKPCKEMMKRGTSVFEYDWSTEDDDILMHAMSVADALGLELLMEAPVGTGSRTAA